MSEEYIVTVGKILREWGLNGEVIVLPLTFDPKRFLKLREVALQSSGKIEYKKIRSARPHKGNILLAFNGCKTRDEAKKYRDALIKIKSSESPKLPEGVYYHYQIIDLNVYTIEGDYLGKIVSIVETGSNDVYVVKGDNREYLIPAIKDAVKEIDLKSKKMIVKLMEAVEE